ncbi:hypothetical protein VF21_02390 [Pseudogymnoascus sp. 05NY08]|nr:hypothetical protein VF21_02390 [Pseudogymnoascus sp. 05NY08]
MSRCLDGLPSGVWISTRVALTALGTPSDAGQWWSKLQTTGGPRMDLLYSARY